MAQSREGRAGDCYQLWRRG